MKLSSTLLLAGAMLAATAANAQNPLSTEIQRAWMGTINNVIGSAEAMAEENYNFKPTPEVMSFAEVMAHAADSAMGACSAFNGERKTAGAAGKTAKAELIAALHAAQAECEKAYGGLTDAKAMEMVQGRGGQVSRLGTLYQNEIHIEHEYAVSTVYLRLKGIVPPSTANRGMRGGMRGKKQ